MGVLPLPPHVILPTLIRGTGSLGNKWQTRMDQIMSCRRWVCRSTRAADTFHSIFLLPLQLIAVVKGIFTRGADHNGKEDDEKDEAGNGIELRTDLVCFKKP